MQASEARGENGPPLLVDADDVFISYASEDRKIARRLKREPGRSALIRSGA
jgi:hypothetical protein